MVAEYSDLHGGAFKITRLSLWVLLVPPFGVGMCWKLETDKKESNERRHVPLSKEKDSDGVRLVGADSNTQEEVKQIFCHWMQDFSVAFDWKKPPERIMPAVWFLPNSWLWKKKSWTRRCGGAMKENYWGQHLKYLIDTCIC